MRSASFRRATVVGDGPTGQPAGPVTGAEASGRLDRISLAEFSRLWLRQPKFSFALHVSGAHEPPHLDCMVVGISICWEAPEVFYLSLCSKATVGGELGTSQPAPAVVVGGEMGGGGVCELLGTQWEGSEQGLLARPTIADVDCILATASEPRGSAAEEGTCGSADGQLLSSDARRLLKDGRVALQPAQERPIRSRWDVVAAAMGARGTVKIGHNIKWQARHLPPHSHALKRAFAAPPTPYPPAHPHTSI